MMVRMHKELRHMAVVIALAALGPATHVINFPASAATVPGPLPTGPKEPSPKDADPKAPPPNPPAPKPSKQQ